MLSKKIQNALNKQIAMESNASQAYLAMSNWCNDNALDGCKAFFTAQSDEERMHMMKILNYVQDSDGKVVVPAIDKPSTKYKNVLDIFKAGLKNEKEVSKAINNIITLCMDERDYQTYHFMEWYLDEQHEEESLFRGIIDRINLIGMEGQGLHMIDEYVKNSRGEE